MISKKHLRLGVCLTAISFLPPAHAAGELASGTITLHYNTGDAYVDGLPATKTINLAGDTVTAVATCSGQVRKQIVGTGSDAIVVTQTFDAAGNLLSRRDATGAGTDYAYDALNRKISETDAQIPGKVTTFAYDAANRLISKTDPLGIVTTFEYDPRDRLVKESTPMNTTETRIIRYGYDGRGHLTTLTDANGGVTTWGFDSAGRNTSKTYPNGDHRSMAYDGVGRLVKLIDENGDIIDSAYDFAGRLVSKHYSKDNSTDTFAYDSASRITSATKGRYGHTLTYAYDNAGRLATETHPDGAVTHFEYDLVNRLAKLTHTPAGGGAPTNSTLYGFDGRGLLANVSAGDYATRYEYRINGQLASTVDYRSATPQADILRVDRSYDAGARLIGVANTAANGEQVGVLYTLGTDDQRLSATEETGARWNYSYDQLKQLTAAHKTDTNAATIPPLDQSYGFDPMGNRRTYTEQGKSLAYTTNTANQYSSVSTTTNSQLSTANSVYDHNGNTLADGRFAYTWDADNQLTSVTQLNPTEGVKKVAFTYDWRGRRITKSVATFVAGTWQNTGATDFKYHEWNLIAEKSTDLTTPAVSPATEKRYVWGNDLSGSLHGAGGVGGLLSMAVFPPSASTTETYFHAMDGNGNVRALVKADAANPAASAITARYAYDGFGKEVAVGGADADRNAFRFSTKQLDADTGMNYYGYRYHMAIDGRWINRDLIMEKGGLNIYATNGNNSILKIDKLGLKPSDTTSSCGICECAESISINNISAFSVSDIMGHNFDVNIILNGTPSKDGKNYSASLLWMEKLTGGHAPRHIPGYNLGQWNKVNLLIPTSGTFSNWQNRGTPTLGLRRITLHDSPSQDIYEEKSVLEFMIAVTNPLTDMCDCPKTSIFVTATQTLEGSSHTQNFVTP